jgi:hypothetical protein
MSNPISRRASPLCLAVGVALLSAELPVPAWAQEGIQSVRLGRHAGYARIVLEVPASVDAYTTGDPKRIEIDAAPPALAAQTRDQLAALGVRLEGSGGRTRIVLEPGATRPWTAFRLTQGAPRIVVDLGTGAPGLPADAEPLRDQAPPPEPAPPPAALPGVGVDPASTALQSSAPGASPAVVRVRVQGIDLVGLPATGPSRDEILDLGLSVRRTAGGDWEAASGAKDAQKRSLHELTSSAADGPALTGSALQHVVERIAAVYAERGLFGTRVDIRQRDVDRLTERPGPLVVHIRPYRAPGP